MQYITLSTITSVGYLSESKQNKMKIQKLKSNCAALIETEQVHQT